MLAILLFMFGYRDGEYVNYKASVKEFIS